VRCAGLLPQEPFEGINPIYPYAPELHTLVALQEYTSTTDFYSEEEEEEEEYNEYQDITGEGYDGPSELSDSSSHGSKPLVYSEPSPHGDGWSDFDSPSPGPPFERRRKRLREGEDSPDEGVAPARTLDGSLPDGPLSPVSKMPKFD
jgi:hypothetical protein